MLRLLTTAFWQAGDYSAAATGMTGSQCDKNTAIRRFTIALGGESSDPLACGDACCTTLVVCDGLSDLRRAAEWCEQVVEFTERRRFLRGMVSWAGFKQVSLPYERGARHAGTSKYPLTKMISFAMDGIISFSLVPLKLAIWTGFLAIWIAVAGIIVAIVDRVMDKNLTRGWASLFVAVLFMGGVQLVSLGILGEYLGRIYTEVKRRPLYVVQERLGFAKSKPKSKSAEVNAVV